MFKDLLIHVAVDKAMAVREKVAIELARRFEAHLTGICFAVDPVLAAAMRGMVSPSQLLGQRKAVLERAESTAADFRATLEKEGLIGECRVVECREGEVTDLLSIHARHADLVVLGQPNRKERTADSPELADVIFSCGRPAIVVPYIGSVRRLGERVLVAWDGGREAARAVNDALPILEEAKSVTILSVLQEPSGNGTRREPGVDIALHLARHGVKAEVTHRIAVDIAVGDTILNEISDNDIDLLVMGCYGHSRLRELVLGGVTEYILGSMTAPLLISH